MKLCKCGCGQEIIIKPHHKYVGIPDYISGHNRQGCKRSDSFKKKQSERMNVDNPMFNEEIKQRATESRKGYSPSKETRQKMCEIMRGRILTEEWKRKIGEANKGNIPWHKGLHHSTETKNKISQSQSGENGHNWKGGKIDYWLKELKLKYTECVLCKSKKYLEMHHIDCNRDNNNRSNLIILCRKCHRWWHKH